MELQLHTDLPPKSINKLQSFNSSSNRTKYGIKRSIQSWQSIDGQYSPLYNIVYIHLQ